MSEKLELWAISGRVIDDNDDTVHLVWGKTDGDAEDKFKKLLAAEIENDETSESEDDADLIVISKTKVGVMLDGVFCLERSIADDWSDSCMETRLPKPKF